jgi:protein-L-isoaspartate(D-aspartate) O-methyltransferase
MLERSRLQGHEHVLVIGAATGYSAAVAARLAKTVVALEEQPDLAAIARRELADTGVEVVEGPLNQGWSQRGPYDFVLLDGAVEFVPQAIIDQVAEGGELAAAILDGGVPRLSIGRVVEGNFGSAAYTDSAAPILPGFERPRTFSF